MTTTLESTPKSATHWSTRSLAAHLGVSSDAVWRTWQAFGLQPHRQEKFKLSADPQFIEKVYDICGLACRGDFGAAFRAPVPLSRDI